MSVKPWLNDIYNNILQRVCSNKLHHGILVSTIRGIGSEELIDKISYTLLCQQPTLNGRCGKCQSCQLVNAGNHPDLITIESEKQIGVDSIREAINKLIGTAQFGGNKVLVMQKAETMTEAASNALLKTLEEPTQNTYLFLVTSETSRLLPTIVSRCEKVVLKAPSENEALEWLAQQGIKGVSESMLEAYGGAPILVQEALAENSELTFDEFLLSCEALQAGSMSALDLALKWQSQASQVVKWSQLLVNKRYRTNVDSASYRAYKHCISAAKTLNHAGVNKVIILNRIFDSLKGK